MVSSSLGERSWRCSLHVLTALPGSHAYTPGDLASQRTRSVHRRTPAARRWSASRATVGTGVQSRIWAERRQAPIVMNRMTPRISREVAMVGLLVATAAWPAHAQSLADA